MLLSVESTELIMERFNKAIFTIFLPSSRKGFNQTMGFKTKFCYWALVHWHWYKKIGFSNKKALNLTKPNSNKLLKQKIDTKTFRNFSIKTVEFESKFSYWLSEDQNVKEEKVQCTFQSK